MALPKPKTSSKQADGSFCHFLVPKQRVQTWTQYDWQEHGRDGLEAITKFLKLNGFWTNVDMEVSNVAPPMIGQSTKEKNLVLLSNIVPRAMWKDFHTPRRVKLIIHDEMYLDNYEWSIHAGIPDSVETCFLRPVSSVAAMPGATQATYYLQSKGHWFWGFFPHEGTGNLQTKWIRGRTPPGKAQWRPDYAGDISLGVGHVNDFQFVQGLYLNIADSKFPLFLYMERPPRRGNQNEQLHLLACTDVPRPVEATLHPSAFAPRRMPAPGPVSDPSRKQMMWQEGENGPVTFQVQNMIFWVAHPGAPIYRKQGTMSDWSAGGWRCIGTLGTEAQDAEDPKDDVPDKWAFFLADEVLLQAPEDPNYAQF